MVDDSPAPHPHTALPIAPRLQRSMRLRRALNLPRLGNAPTSRTEQSRRRKFWGNFFMFIAAQVLIAAIAFVLVRDYMADGYIKQSVSNIFSLGDGDKAKIDRDATVAVKPPAVPDEIASQEVAPVEKLPVAIEPVETSPAQTQEKIVSTQSTPQVEEQATAQAVEPEPLPKAVEPASPPVIEPEPAPLVVTQAAPPADEPEPVPQVTEQVVAVAPIPDLTPLKDAPATAVPSEPTTPQQAEGQAFRDCETCPEMVMIPPGRFAMGAGSEGLGQQASVATGQEIAIAAPFAIGRQEITFDEWAQCVNDGGCTSAPADENWGRGRHPVINVSFNDITQQFLPWLSRKTGFTYRLPTEAEWEFAARGGASAAAGQAYSFGEDAEQLCEYGNSSDLAARTSDANWTGINCNDGFATTAPVGSLKPNALGLFDMHGNVWEWTADCWHPQYSAKPVKPGEACNSRVMRGGSWASDAPALRTAVRGWEKQDKSKNSIGFRVARQQP